MRFLWIGGLLVFVTSLTLKGQNARSYALSVGLSVNPGLMIMHKEYEAGPVITLSTPIRKHWQIGVGVLSRAVWWTARDKRFGYKKNVSYSYNIENVYFTQLGYTTLGKRWQHSFEAVGGYRQELYQEKVVNTTLNIAEGYSLNEGNFMYGLAYGLKYRLKESSSVCLRWMVPLNRSPYDDINRHSLEIAYQISLRRK